MLKRAKQNVTMQHEISGAPPGDTAENRAKWCEILQVCSRNQISKLYYDLMGFCYNFAVYSDDSQNGQIEKMARAPDQRNIHLIAKRFVYRKFIAHEHKHTLHFFKSTESTISITLTCSDASGVVSFSKGVILRRSCIVPMFCDGRVRWKNADRTWFFDASSRQIQA